MPILPSAASVPVQVALSDELEEGERDEGPGAEEKERGCVGIGKRGGNKDSHIIASGSKSQAGHDSRKLHCWDLTSWYHGLM